MNTSRPWVVVFSDGDHFRLIASSYGAAFDLAHELFPELTVARLFPEGDW